MLEGRKAEKRKLSDLVVHPLQSTYNDGLHDEALNTLAKNIKKHGLRDMIEVMPANKAGLPKNCILDGHQRLKALLINGETSTTVEVCYDLANADAVEVEKAFIESNMVRQHKDNLLRARAAFRLFELLKGGRLIRAYHGEARDYIGNIYGASGRNLSRYFRLLRGPIQVQDAFRTHKIPLVLAEKVCELTPREQKQISDAIVAGVDPRSAIEAFIPPKSPYHDKANDGLVAFVKSLEYSCDDIAGRINKVSPNLVRKNSEALLRAKTLIEGLLYLR